MTTPARAHRTPGTHIPNSVPAPLAVLRQWLVWRYVLKNGKDKPDKVPYYVNGDSRTGTQGSEQDRSRWAQLDDARRAASVRGFNGVGFAMDDEGGIVALDFDHCIKDGEVHPEVARLIAGTYAELSPSGTGVRAFFTGMLLDRKSHMRDGPFEFGFEVFCHKGFVTVTGRALPGHPPFDPSSGEFPQLPNVVREFYAQRFIEVNDPDRSGAPRDGRGNGATFFRRVNDLGLQRLECWVPALIPDAERRRGGHWRISSKSLTRDLEEDYTLTPEGIVDFGVHDIGDPRKGRRTAIDAVIDLAPHHIDSDGLLDIRTPKVAALWLCERMGVEPVSLGWREPVTFAHGSGEFRVSSSEVWFVPVDGEGAREFVCSWLTVRGHSRDPDGVGWGRDVEWADGDGKLHRWSLPAALLEGDGIDVRKGFADRGLRIGATRRARELFIALLKFWPTDTRLRCVHRTGWHDGVFVTPTETFGHGTGGELVTYQSEQAVEPAYSVRGTLDGWKEAVSAYAVGNPHLCFALSVAFAAPVLAFVGAESGGFHLRGKSTAGKSTLGKAAASVHGNPAEFVRTWKATANGLEGLAAIHNDGLLILDEIAQCEPAVVSDAAYLLANGQGKARAARTGFARKPQRWRLLFMSSGEMSLTEMMATVGRRPNAGQEIRLADIGVDANVFEDLHGSDDGSAFAKVIEEGIAANHGAVGRSWLDILAHKGAEAHAAPLQAAVIAFSDRVVPKGASAQVKRVARRFGVVAAAGELATAHGLTNWPTGCATDATQACFNLWLDGFGKEGNKEDRQVVEALRTFIDQYGTSRFEPLSSRPDVRVQKRAGFYRPAPQPPDDDDDDGLNEGVACSDHLDDGREYLVLPDVFRSEICDGRDWKSSVRVLIGLGIIVPGTDGKATQKPRIPQLGSTRRLYVVSSNKLFEDR